VLLFIAAVKYFGNKTCMLREWKCWW